jgi:adenylate kinase
MNIIFLGAPGAGKGTQAEIVSAELKIPIISTGNLIREAIKNQTPDGLVAKSYTESGALVPDELVLSIMKSRLSMPDCKNGFILDGFPRTLTQAQELGNMDVKIDKVIDFEISDKAVTERMGGRRVCEGCGSSYHIKNKPPKSEGICNSCGGKLGIRKDDDPEVVLSRLKVYHAQTEPLTKYYTELGILYGVNAERSLDEITTETLKVLGCQV